MANKNTYRVYHTGSVKGFVLGEAEEHIPTKVTYIKIRKGDRVRYLGEDGDFVDEVHAKRFEDPQEANELVREMRQNPSYKNLDIRPFETSYMPNSYEVPKPKQPARPQPTSEQHIRPEAPERRAPESRTGDHNKSERKSDIGIAVGVLAALGILLAIVLASVL